MLTYDLDAAGSDPLYVFLYKCIKADIICGRLTPGEALPSKRAFAKHLGVSTITVENAYGQLTSEGYIVSRPRRGFYVAALSELPLRNRQAAAVLSPEPEAGRTWAALTQTLAAPRWFADFASNQTDPERFPFSIWAKISRAVLSREQPALMENPPAGGTAQLRRAIAGQLRDFRGMAVSPEQIIVGAGTEYLYGLLIQLLGFDKIYAVETPGYRKVAQIYRAHGLTVAEIPLDHAGLMPDRLATSGASVVHLTPSHHFPTGRTMPISRRCELLGWASRAPNRFIIEDDYDSEFRMNGRPIPPLYTIDDSRRVIYINTFTKSLASTVRVSYMVLPFPLAARFYKELRFYACTVSTFEQFTLARFIAEGHYEKHINRTRLAYKRRRDTLLAVIDASPLAARARIAEENAGLHFLMTIDTEKPDRALIADAAREGIHLAALSDYGEAGAHTFVINYSSIPDGRMAEAVARLYRAVVA
jgi:GntR family transcriptional regulator/MocR family aminotransferase